MEEWSVVNLNGKPAGKVQVLRQGLYYAFHCRCERIREQIHRLVVICGDRQENLGILVPMDGVFGLDKKLPIKQIGEGKMTFVLLPKQEIRKETFVAIYPEEPFAYLSRLKSSFLEIRDGQIGISIQCPAPDQQGNGRIP